MPTSYHKWVWEKRGAHVAGRPGSSEVPRNPLTRWDVSSIPANGIFLTKKRKKNKQKKQRVENDYIVSRQNSTSRLLLLLLLIHTFSVLSLQLKKLR